MEIFGTAAIIIGIFGIVKSIIDISRALDSDEWPRVDCIILESEVETRINQNETGMSIFYIPQIRYQYKYGDPMFIGNKIQYGHLNFISLKTDADIIVKSFKKGQQSQVSVNPNNPKVSVLLPGLALHVYLYLFFYLTAFGIGLYFLLHSAA